MATMTPAVVNLWLSINGTTALALSIPLAKCRELAVNPLKWLQYLGYAIYVQEGYISMSDTGPPIDNYTADIAARSSYFISSDQPRLVDINALDGRTLDHRASSDVSSLSDRRADFKDKIVDCDVTCVSTSDLHEYCDACHIIPHSKGDSYIANTLNYRSGGDIVHELDGINDLQHGLLLRHDIHIGLGAGTLAFLKTPNFCLSVDDIPYHPHFQGNQASTASSTSRLTLHYIIDSRLGNVLPLIAPNNSDSRELADTRKWPPALLFDISYACAAVQAWAPASFVQTVQKMVKDTYYHASGGEPGDAGPSDVGARKQCPHAQNKKTAQAAHPEELTLSSVVDGVMALWMRSATPAKGNQQETTASDLVHSRDKVQGWLDSDGPDFNGTVVTEGE